MDRRGRKYLIELAGGATFHSHAGMIRHDDLIGAPVARWYPTSGGAMLLATRPRPMDYVLEMPRLAQVVYPKDFGAIIWRMGIRPGFEVLEVGLGSGALSIALLLAVGDGGRLVSLDLRRDHAERAVRNVERLFGSGVVDHRVIIGDAAECLRGEAKFDASVIDIPDPWRVIDAVTPLLRNGAFLASFNPSAAQVSETVSALESAGYAMVETVEVMERGWHVKGKAVRPQHRMVAHTGFVTVGCRTAVPRRA